MTGDRNPPAGAVATAQAEPESQAEPGPVAEAANSLLALLFGMGADLAAFGAELGGDLEALLSLLAPDPAASGATGEPADPELGTAAAPGAAQAAPTAGQAAPAAAQAAPPPTGPPAPPPQPSPPATATPDVPGPGPAAEPEPGGPAPTAAGVPSGAAELRARVDAAAAALPHPTAPTVEAARAPLDRARAGIEARTYELRASPQQIAGRPPAGHPPPLPEPVPVEMKALRDRFGAHLDAKLLEPPQHSPLGTMPDPAGPVLTPGQLGALAMDRKAIELLYEGATDQDQLDDLARLRELDDKLTQQAKTPAAEPAAAPVPQLVYEQPLPALRLTDQQRALFGQVVELLKSPQEDNASKVLATIRQGHPGYPDGALARIFPTLGESLVSRLKRPLDVQIADLEAALQDAPDRIDAALAVRRRETGERRDAAAQATAAAAAQAKAGAAAADGRTRAAVRAVAAATTRAVAGGRERAPRISRTQARVEQAIAALRDPVALDLARIDEELRERRAGLTDAVRKQVAAIGYAKARDLRTLAASAPPTGADPELLNRVSCWAQDEVAKQEAALPQLLTEAGKQADGLKDAVRAAAATAMQALRVWGAAHTRAGDTWWAARDAELAQWSKAGDAQAAFWAAEQQQASRLALVADLAAAEQFSEVARDDGRHAALEFVAGLDGEARTVVLNLLGQQGQRDYAAALLAGVLERVRTAEHAGLETALDGEVLALDPEQEKVFKNLTDLLAVVQPDADLKARASKIEEATHRLVAGHDEDAIFEAMAGLTPLAGRLLPVVYRRDHEGTLEDALRGSRRRHLTEDEMTTAHRLLSGSRVDGAVGTIRTALGHTWSTNFTAVNQTLRALTPSERIQVAAAYLARYDTILEADLRGQSVPSAQVEETLAILRGDLIAANAIALAATVRALPSGGEFDTGVTYEIDRAAAAAVLGRSEAEAAALGGRQWTSAEVHAAAVVRNRQMLAKVDVLARDAPWAMEGAPGATPSQVALSMTGSGGDLLAALAAGDRTRVDVARIRLEDAGVWASDKVLVGVFQDQDFRARDDVARDYGPILEERRAARLRGLRGEALVDERMRLEAQDDRQLDILAAPVAQERMKALGAAYEREADRSLEAMVRANMSGNDAAEARAWIAGGGVLTPAQQVHYAIGGWRTDVPRLRKVVGKLTKEELEAVDRDWRKSHGQQSLLAAIEDNTSGRDAGDLKYMVENGRPVTAHAAVLAVRAKLERDRRQSTRIGRWWTRDETRVAARDVAELEQQYAELHSGDPAAADRAEIGFSHAVDRAEASIDRQRAAVDSAADLLATIAAIAVGVLLTPFTGGASMMVAGAMISSVIAMGVSMAVKSLVKGGAYGRQEFNTDLAIGAVDVVVAALTAGLGKALLGSARAVGAAQRSLLMRVLSRMGAVGRAAATTQTRAVGLLSRLGSQGLLARMVERRALLAGLHASESRMARMVAGGAAHLIESGVQAVPSSLAGALADRETVRDGPWAVLRSTAASTAHSMAIGAAVSSVHHVLGGSIAAVDKRFEISKRVTEYVAESFAPAPRLDTPAGRLTAFRDWRALQRPGGSMAEFRGLLSEGLAAQSRQAGEAHALARAARRELLAGLPPAERGQYAGIPVVAAPTAEFARLPGDPDRAARLVTRDGQAVVALREGAPVTAAASVLPEMRSRVLPGTGGLTVSAALPPSLRDVPAFVDPALPGDEIQVVPTDAADGRVAGVELRVAPGADPVQIALHAGEIRRWQGWIGALGRAREALAGVARLAGAEPVTPGRRGTVHGEAERARFEAAGEARKLDPLIQERLRQYAGAADAPAADRLRAQVAHMVTQLESARRIATGEVIAQPRGYVAMSDTLAKNARPPAEVSAALRELRERERVLSQQIADHESRMDPDLVVALARRKELRGLLELFGDHPIAERLRTLDPQGPAFGETLREFALPSDPIQQGRNRILYEERRGTLRLQATGKHVKPAERLHVERTDLLGAYVDFLIADQRLRPHREALSRLHPQRDAVRAGIAEIYGAAGVQYHADVLVSPLLRENIPPGGWRREPRPLLSRGSTENRMSHRLGEETEIRFANVLVEGGTGTDIGTGQNWHLVKWGAPPGELGKKADIIAAPDIGLPVLADTKYRASGQVLGVSETFSKRLYRARAEAMELLRDRAVPGLSPAARDQALANLRDWKFSTWTVYSEEIGVFHYAVEQVFTGTDQPMVLVHPTIDWRLP